MRDTTLESRTHIHLAIAFRWAARLGMHESIANHVSVAVSGDGAGFLLDADDPHVVTGPDAPDHAD